jgi:hypothetical protein
MKKTNGSKLQGKNEGLPQLGQVYFFDADVGACLVKIVAHLESGSKTDIVFKYEEKGCKQWDYTADVSKFQALRLVGSEDLTRWADYIYGGSPKLN